jgi:hypothetical protein
LTGWAWSAAVGGTFALAAAFGAVAMSAQRRIDHLQQTRGYRFLDAYTPRESRLGVVVLVAGVLSLGCVLGAVTALIYGPFPHTG